MTAVKPLVIGANGLPQQLQSSDVLDGVYGAVGMGGAYPAQGKCQGTTPTLLLRLRLNAGSYAAPVACIGASSGSATMTLHARDGTLLATISATGAADWVTASAGFTLTSLTDIWVRLVASNASATAYSQGALEILKT